MIGSRSDIVAADSTAKTVIENGVIIAVGVLLLAGTWVGVQNFLNSGAQGGSDTGSGADQLGWETVSSAVLFLFTFAHLFSRPC